MIQYIKKDITTVTKGIVALSANNLSKTFRAVKFVWPTAYSQYNLLVRQYDNTEELLGTTLAVDVSSEPASGDLKPEGTLFITYNFVHHPRVHISWDATRDAIDQLFALAENFKLPIFVQDNIETPFLVVLAETATIVGAEVFVCSK